jgi:site-specific recombinase XerD
MNETAYRVLSGERGKNGWVFSGKDGGQLNGHSVSKHFKSLVRKCGLPESIHFHSLRHSGASWLIQGDVPLYTVQKILGHTSPTVTQIYSHLSHQNLRQAVEQIFIPQSHVGLN